MTASLKDNPSGRRPFRQEISDIIKILIAHFGVSIIKLGTG